MRVRVLTKLTSSNVSWVANDEFLNWRVHESGALILYKTVDTGVPEVGSFEEPVAAYAPGHWEYVEDYDGQKE